MGHDSTFIERSHLVDILDDAGAILLDTPIELPAEPDLDDVIAALVEAGIVVEAA